MDPEKKEPEIKIDIINEAQQDSSSKSGVENIQKELLSSKGAMNEDLRLTQQSINYEKKKKKDKPDENTSLLSKGEDEGDIESGKKKKRTPRKSMKSPRKSMRSSSNMFKNKQPKQKIANYKNYEERVEGEFEDKCYEIVKSENWE